MENKLGFNRELIEHQIKALVIENQKEQKALWDVQVKIERNSAVIKFCQWLLEQQQAVPEGVSQNGLEH